MRLVVACPQCRRQYDVSRERVGTRLRCRCGSEVQVQPVRGHAAAVVRCSACGAPREGGAAACGFCGADFTIHEKDLESVCPSCFALVSSRARFCHACGGSLAAEAPLFGASAGRCPVCGPDKTLRSRILGDKQLAADECQVCGGLWLDLAVVLRLLDGELDVAATTLAAPPQIAEDSRRYRPCAVCGQFMNRRNVGGTSGVIVDLCGKHGLWFDAGELAQLLAWMRAGGLAAARHDLLRLPGMPESLRKQAQRIAGGKGDGAPPKPRAWSSLSSPDDSSDDGGGFLGALLSGLNDLFGSD